MMRWLSKHLWFHWCSFPKRLSTKLGLALLATLSLLAMVAITPTNVLAHTDPGGPPIPKTPTRSTPASATSHYRTYIQQDATWLSEKNSYRVFSGIDPTKPRKGQMLHPSILPANSKMLNPLGCPQVAAPLAVNPSSCGTPPAAKTLTLDQYASATWEPSDGTHPNYGAGTAMTDDQGTIYGLTGGGLNSNHDFYLLCGPGASDVVLDFWPSPPNLLINSAASDPSYNNATGFTHNTYWNGLRMRGYMTYLAWQTQAPDWPTPGMMDTSVYPSNGVTEYDVVEGLNWEASGKNVNGWHDYFYTIRWWSDPGVTSATLNSDVTSDIGGGSVPVQAEVNLQLLPNGTGIGSTYHQIAIIGYDNTAHTYTYVDTCAFTTACNGAAGNNHTSRVFTVSQAQMWNAITSVQVNKSPLPQFGDGGWVW